MLESVGNPDKDLIRDISSGFKLTGWQAKTKFFRRVLSAHSSMWPR